MNDIYLCGPMSYSSRDGESWRDRVINEYGDRFTFADPRDNINTMEDGMFVPQPWQSNAELAEADGEVVYPDEIVNEDRRLIYHSYVLLMGMQETIEFTLDGETVTSFPPTPGSHREHEYATEQLGIPSVVWYTDEVDNVPSWIQYGPEFMSTSLGDCMEFIEQRIAEDRVFEAESGW